MAGLKVTFKLGDEDLIHLKCVMRVAAASAKQKGHEKIVESALAMVKRARDAEPPAYVLERIATLEDIARMVQDADWRLATSVRNRICCALAYFSHPHDLIPDHVPVLGFLDDAIMIEIAAQEFQHEIQGYREFCRYRERLARRLSSPEEQPLLRKRVVEKRRQIRARIQAKRDGSEGVSLARGRRFRLW